MIIGFVSSSLFRTILYDVLKRHLDGAVSSALMILALGFLVLGSLSLEFHTVCNSAFVGLLIAVAGGHSSRRARTPITTTPTNG